MKRIALFLLFLPLVASAQIAYIEPQSGFPFAETIVRIAGLNLAPETDCEAPCATPCAVRVFSGDLEGRVLTAGPGHVRVAIPAQPAGTTKTFILRVPGRADQTFSFHWVDGDIASSENYVRYLIPVALEGGGFGGSYWTTQWTVHNGSDHLLAIAGATLPTYVDPPRFPTVAPHATDLFKTVPRGDANDGAFVYVPRALDGTTTMTLHVRDESRAAQSLGSEVPVPRVEDFRFVQHLAGIPTDARYRATLRIYSASYGPGRARVRTYFTDDLTEEVRLLDERLVDLSGYASLVPVDMPAWPAYAQLDPLTSAVRAAGPRVRVEVASESNVPLWAMVSITSNATQQVTIVSPLE